MIPSVKPDISSQVTATWCFISYPDINMSSHPNSPTLFSFQCLSVPRRFTLFVPPPPTQPPTLRRLRGRLGGGDVRLSTLDKWFCFDSSTLYSNVSALVDSEFINNARDYVTILFMCLSPGSTRIIVLRVIHDRWALQSIDVEAFCRMRSKY